MSDLMDYIVAEMEIDVKKNISNVFNNLQPVQEIPRFLDDPSIQHIHVEPAEKVSYAETLTPIAEITHAYSKLVERGTHNKLSDSFCGSDSKETYSRTAYSFTQTLASYNKYISILQTAN